MDVGRARTVVAGAWTGTGVLAVRSPASTLAETAP